MTLKEFLAERRKIAEAVTQGPWQFYLDRKDRTWPGEYAVHTNVFIYGMDGEEGIFVNNPADPAFIADAHSHYIMLLRIIEVQDAALEFISPKIPHPARDLFRSREMIIAAEARERVEALLSNPKEQEKE